MRLSLVVLVLFFSSASSFSRADSVPAIQDGILDLTHWRFEDQGALKLNGNWHFHWMNLQDPSGTLADYPGYMPVPAVWNNRHFKGEQMSGSGYATYAIQILRAENAEPLHLILPEMNMAFRLWANGAQIASSGVVGTSSEDSVPRSQPLIASLPDSTDIVLVLQISNFYHMEGGIPRAIEIDQSETVLSNFELTKIINIFTIGALCIVALHYLALYIGRPEESGYLMYAILAILFGLRVLAVSKLPYLLIDHPHIVSTRLSYITMFLLPTVYLLFIRSLFPKEVSKYLAYSLLVIGTLGTCWTMFTPASVFTTSRNLFSNIIVVSLVYTVIAVLLAAYRGREDAKLVLLLNGVLAITGINDTLLYQQLIQSIDLSQYGFLIFISGHAVVLGRRMNRSFVRENEAKRELAEFAASLQSRVEERTSDLAEKVGLLQRKEEELAQAREVAVNANEAKSKFLAGASHDLKQPMHALSLYVQMLENSIKKGTSEAVTTSIRASLLNLDTLLDDLVKVSQLEAGVLEPVVRSIHLGACLDGITDEFALIAAEKGLDFRSVRTTALVRTDTDLLGRIIRNLISNAIKYTNEGKVLIGCRRQHDKICIQIWDTGMGISSNDVEAIFEEFTRTNTTNVTGSGLGLSIARGFSQILGHDLKVSSSPGKGSCFSVTLDRVTAATMASVQQPVKATMELDELEDLTVVFIDDDPTVRSAMRDLLTDWGCRVSAVAGRVEAMATIEELDCPPDLILCDYHLHGESGLDVLTALHSTIGYTVPGIIITADKNLVTTSLSGLASTEILYKPVDATVLRHTIVNLLASYAEEA